MIATFARRLFIGAALGYFVGFTGPLFADSSPVPTTDRGLKTEFIERLRALETPLAPVDMYADEKSSDLARIKGQTDLFDPSRKGFGPAGVPRIAIFIGPDCPECDAALADLKTLAQELKLRVVILNVSTPDNAATMAALGLDVVPSYVMQDRLIRGQMPALVLRRYLSGAAD